MTEIKKKILIGCSGGPDSMALLDMMKDKYEVYVAHVNYHHRDSAKRDENIVKKYCKKNNIAFYKKDFKDEEESGNFQDKARVFRYAFYAELIKKHKLEFVMVAHHKDDLIETYLLQEKRKGDVTYFGLNKEVIIQGICVKRPLLKYTKNDLLNYCEKNNVEYGIDESNLTDSYTRNKIRHSVIEKMTLKEKNKLIKEINLKNKKQKEEIVKVTKFINKRTRINVDEFVEYDDQTKLLRTFIGYNLSKKQIDEISRQIKSVNSFEVLIKDKYLVKEYGYVEVYEKEKDYSYKLNNIGCFKQKHFRLSKKGSSKQGVTLSNEDFPITIRNFKNGDSIQMRYGTKKLNRFFIDNKISSKDRKIWPIMLNKKGNAILVPEIGCDKYHYSNKHNLYMIKL